MAPDPKNHKSSDVSKDGTRRGRYSALQIGTDRYEISDSQTGTVVAECWGLDNAVRIVEALCAADRRANEGGSDE